MGFVMIHLKQVTKTYALKGQRIKALNAVDLSVAPGEIFGIIGGSGAGKSTCLRCVNLLEVPDAGEVCVDGQDLTRLSGAQLRQARRNIGMIFQHFNLVNVKTAFENVALPLKLAGESHDVIEKRVMELLSLVGLSDHAQAYPHELSGGQKQRVAIARALASNPKILLCDEATSALDPQTTQSILSLLNTINRELGITILLITHEMDVIKQICHRMAVLHQGEIIEQGNVLDIFTQPQHEVTKAFVARTMAESLPSDILNRLSKSLHQPNDQPLLHLAFRGHAAVEPVISGLVQRCQTDVNIFQAHLETIQGEGCGTMMLALSNAEQVDVVLDYLKSQGVAAEVLGYVAAA